MNSTLDIIKSRRTSRKYKSDQISKESIDLIIEAGLFAPSANNNQPWHFTVIQDQDFISELNVYAKKSLLEQPNENLKKAATNEAFNLFYNAPTMVIVSGENAAAMPMVDCAAATQNMFIAAESLEIGGCWNGLINYLFTGSFKDEYIKKLQIPEGYTPYYAAVFGYSDGKSNGPPRRENTVNYL